MDNLVLQDLQDSEEQLVLLVLQENLVFKEPKEHLVQPVKKVRLDLQELMEKLVFLVPLVM